MSIGGIRAFTFTPDDGVPPAVAPFAHATAAGETLHVTGQMPTDMAGAVVGDDVATQTDQVLRNLLRSPNCAVADWPTSSRCARSFSIGTTTSHSMPPTRAGFRTASRAAPASAPPVSRSAPWSRSTGCVGETTAGVIDTN